VKDLRLLFPSQASRHHRLDIARAIAREKELKGWRRAKKIALIESMNAVWTDLSRDWYEYEPADYKRALDRMET
jgi:putative endonuclease